jgi:2-isopropylmalate synthase
MRDGELTPGIKMNLQEKISIAQLLEAMGVDTIEVGYPGHYEKDFDEIFNISKLIENSTICGIASSNENEITSVAQAIKPAKRGRINTYTLVNLKNQSGISKEQELEKIKETVSFARNYCNDVQWSAFDATRSEPDFLCQAIEVAIKSGATTISIPDSMGVALPEEFSQLIQTILNRVPNIERAIVSVHCHDDLGMAVDNSIAALACGVRQIECSINGLGARKGNADLEKVVMEVVKQGNFPNKIDLSLIETASELVAKITGIKNKKMN